MIRLYCLSNRRPIGEKCLIIYTHVLETDATFLFRVGFGNVREKKSKPTD